MSEKSIDRSILFISFSFFLGFVAAFVLPELIKQFFILGKESNATIHFISVYGRGLMIGLWAGVWAAFGLSESKKEYINLSTH